MQIAAEGEGIENENWECNAVKLQSYNERSEKRATGAERMVREVKDNEGYGVDGEQGTKTFIPSM